MPSVPFLATLRTARFVVRLARPNESALLVDYLLRNRTHIGPWEPEPPRGYLTEEFWRERLGQIQGEEKMGLCCRFHAFSADESRVVGTIGLTNIVRGCSQSASLGFGLDETHQGSGAMLEIARAVVDHAFGPLRLHRIEANHQPQNVRSAALLRRLGFVPYGYSRDYLRIGGRWVDHVHTALTNAAWKPE